MNGNYFLSDTKPRLCEQQRHSHKLAIEECLFFSLWLTKIIYCIPAKRHPTSEEEAAALVLRRTSERDGKPIHLKAMPFRQRWRKADASVEASDAAYGGTFLPECKEIEEIWGWIEFVKTNIKDLVKMKNIQIVVLDREVGQHSQHAWAVIRHFY